MAEHLNVVPGELRAGRPRASADRRANSAPQPAGHAEVMASLDSLGPIFAEFRDAGGELLDQRRACYEQQAAAHAEMADRLNEPPKSGRARMPRRRNDCGGLRGGERRERTRSASSTPSTPAATCCSGPVAGGYLHSVVLSEAVRDTDAAGVGRGGAAGRGCVAPEGRHADPSRDHRRRVQPVRGVADAGRPQPRRGRPGRSSARRSRRFDLPGFSVPACGPDVVRRRNRIGSEKFAGPPQQRANLVELLLQHRLSHAATLTAIGVQPTIHPRGISALIRSSSGGVAPGFGMPARFAAADQPDRQGA